MKDTGIGIPEKVCERLFQKFSQADSSVTRRYGGTGLGLAICKQLVELMGGEIGVSSRVGAGSTFWFQLRLARSTMQLPDMNNLPTSLKGLRVLVVDDVPMNLEILGRQLGVLGITATTVDDGFAAMAELERGWHRGKPYDIAFLDQMMPGMAGDELAKRIRSNPSLHETRLILVSSAGTHGIEPVAASLLDARLDKPVRQHELLDCLVRVHSAAHPVENAPRLRVERAPPKAATTSLRILLAEDNKINQMFATALLRKAGHTIDVVENGHQAVDAVRHGNYDVVLMDVQMPELDGIGATREIRALAQPKCTIPIIAMTANAMSGAEAQYLSAGMDDYVSKPVQQERLFQKLAKVADSIAQHDKQPVRVKAPESNLVPVAVVNQNDLAAIPVIEPEKLQNLMSALSPAAVESFLTLYRTDTEIHLGRIRELMAEQDLRAVARLAHEVVSTAGNIGIERVSYLARQLETACLNYDAAGASNIAQALISADHLSIAAIDGWMAENLPSEHLQVAEVA